MTDGVAAFLNARLDEDEAAAKAAASVAGPDWQFGADFPTSYLRSARGSILADTLQSGEGQIGPHVACHDPARVLREVAAKRAILAAYVRADGGSPRDRDRGRWDSSHAAVSQLAAVYSGHPDYRQEWAP